jgi:hypothetical protein
LVNCQFALNQGRYTWRHDSVLANIERALNEFLPAFNNRKPAVFAEVARKEFHSSFVRAGQKARRSAAPIRRGLLDYANDWKLQADFANRELVFPPCIIATNLRPDIVIWSMRTCTVILLELTCCAEEGIDEAQQRKEARYQGLLDDINATKIWKAQLLTLEVGARGLVGSRTYRAFRILGLNASQAKSLVKCLSEVVARCSYAIYLAHGVSVWMQSELVFTNSPPKAEAVPVRDPNIVVLRKHGIRELYHFTDASNLQSIRENGLMSASKLQGRAIPSKMNSDELSRQLDSKAGLEMFVSPSARRIR